MVMCKSPVSFFLLVLGLNVLLTEAVWELDRSNFEKFRKTASFPIFFVDSPNLRSLQREDRFGNGSGWTRFQSDLRATVVVSHNTYRVITLRWLHKTDPSIISCSRCRLLYPFFYAASQTFVEDRDIYFGRVQDKSLIREWGIEELPVILYYEKGETEWERLEGDITVDNIVNTIAKAMPGYIGEIKLDYAIEVSDKNYDEIVVTPKQNVLLLAAYHDERDMWKIFEELALAFRFDEQVTICILDVDKYPKLVKERFGHRGLPAVFWYEHNDKYNKYVYGSKIHTIALLRFVNEKTNLWRKRTGYLEDQSGRIEALDLNFKKHIPEIKEGDALKMTNIITDMTNVEVHHSWETDFAEYYIELLERIAEFGEPLETLGKERNILVNIRNDPDSELTQKQMDFFQRKQNVVDFMISSIKDYDAKKERERREEEEAIRNAPPVIIRKSRIEL